MTYKERGVIPENLRQEVLDILHSSHQGSTAMNMIARESVFWLDMVYAIERKRLACQSCDRVAPSQPPAPPYPLPAPTYQFEMISTDYFAYAGKCFLIVVDRYSGWLSVFNPMSPGGGS